MCEPVKLVLAHPSDQQESDHILRNFPLDLLNVL